MKKYNMPKMEISLFDAEVVSTGEMSEQSTAWNNFNQEWDAIIKSGGVTKSIEWKELGWTY